MILLTFFKGILFNSFILWETDWLIADLLLGYSKELGLSEQNVNSSPPGSRQFKLFNYLWKFDTKIVLPFLLWFSLLWFKWKSGFVMFDYWQSNSFAYFWQIFIYQYTFSFRASFRSTISDIFTCTSLPLIDAARLTMSLQICTGVLSDDKSLVPVCKIIWSASWFRITGFTWSFIQLVFADGWNLTLTEYLCLMLLIAQSH